MCFQNIFMGPIELLNVNFHGTEYNIFKLEFLIFFGFFLL